MQPVRYTLRPTLAREWINIAYRNGITITDGQDVVFVETESDRFEVRMLHLKDGGCRLNLDNIADESTPVRLETMLHACGATCTVPVISGDIDCVYACPPSTVNRWLRKAEAAAIDISTSRMWSNEDASDWIEGQLSEGPASKLFFTTGYAVDEHDVECESIAFSIPFRRTGMSASAAMLGKTRSVVEDVGGVCMFNSAGK